MDSLCKTNILTELKKSPNMVTNNIKLFSNVDVVLIKIYHPKRTLIIIIEERYLNTNRFMTGNTQIVLHIQCGN